MPADTKISPVASALHAKDIFLNEATQSPIRAPSRVDHESDLHDPAASSSQEEAKVIAISDDDDEPSPFSSLSLDQLSFVEEAREIDSTEADFALAPSSREEKMKAEEALHPLSSLSLDQLSFLEEPREIHSAEADFALAPSSREEEMKAEEALRPLSSPSLDHPASLKEMREILVADEDKLPLTLRLLEQVEMIIPLLIKLEQGQRLTQQEEMDLMSVFSEKEISNIYFQGGIFFLGNAAAAFITAGFGKEAGQLFSSLTQGVSSLAEGSKTRAQKGYQMEQMDYQETKEVRQNAERLREKLYEAALRADQLSYLRS